MSIKVDYDQLQTTAGQLNAGKEEISSSLTRLKGLVDSLVASGFVTDQASGAFERSYTQWNTGASNAIAGLEGMSQFLNTAIQKHQELDSSLSSSANQA